MNEILDASAHIVVCDGEEDIRETICDISGATAIPWREPTRACATRTVGSQHVDIVILDIRMPGEDGLSLARYLREHFDIAIIMLTGSSEIIDRVVGLEIGADDYVAKPVDLRELLARVKAVLRRTSGRDRIAAEAEVAGQRARAIRQLPLLPGGAQAVQSQRATRFQSRRWSSNF